LLNTKGLLEQTRGGGAHGLVALMGKPFDLFQNILRQTQGRPPGTRTDGMAPGFGSYRLLGS
jgi:hypothetical protein